MSNQFIQIPSDASLSDLNELVGAKNVPDILNVNSLKRSRNIGEQFTELCQNIVSTASEVSWKRKSELLNIFTTDTDVFEHAAVQDENSWKVVSSLLTFPGFLAIPDTVSIPRHDNILGDGLPVSELIYKSVMKSLEVTGTIDNTVFNEFSTIKDVQSIPTLAKTQASPLFQWFNIPWGEIVFYSSLSGESKDIPVYPDGFNDSKSASYATMDSTLYQYEPWYIYSGANGRNLSFEFHMHRQMWTGDETDGKANELLRFVQASIYPRYSGSAVNSDIVTLYISGSPIISGILTDFSVNWTGPIGRDGFYLEFTMGITIAEVSKRALNYDVVKSLPLIG